MVQHARCDDHHISFVSVAIDDSERPRPARIVEGARVNLAIEADIWHHAKALGYALEIGMDFFPGRVIGAPVGVQSKTVAVGMRWRIAGQPRIAVVPPGASKLGALFEHCKVRIATLKQLDSRHHARHSCTDYRIAQTALTILLRHSLPISISRFALTNSRRSCPHLHHSNGLRVIFISSFCA